MKTRIIILTFISLSFTMCNMTFLNHKDYRFRVKDFVWNIKNESHPGQIYVKDSNFIFGNNDYLPISYKASPIAFFGKDKVWAWSLEDQLQVRE